jgi:hypothetical protein
MSEFLERFSTVNCRFPADCAGRKDSVAGFTTDDAMSPEKNPLTPESFSDLRRIIREIRTIS